MKLSKRQKKAFVRQARALLKEKSPLMAENAGSCVYLTAALCLVAHLWDLRVIPQGGSAYWLRHSPLPDDFWGYQYLPPVDPKGLPLEIHVWAALPDTNEIVDLATGEWRQTCAMCEGADWKTMDADAKKSFWPGPIPPSFLWVRGSQYPSTAIYYADADATRRAYEAILEIWDHWKKGIQIVPINKMLPNNPQRRT